MKTINKQVTYLFKMKKSKTGFSNIDSTKFYFHEADAIEIDKILSNLPDGHIITITVDVNEGD